MCRYNMTYEGKIATLLEKEQWNIIKSGVKVGVPNTIRPSGS